MFDIDKNMYDVHFDGRSARFSDREIGVELFVPGVSRADLVLSNRSEAINAREELRLALTKPLDAEPIHRGARGKTAAILVPDMTREFPTAEVLPLVVQELEKAGVPRGDITVVVACGAHRAATGEEEAQILGDRCRDLRIVSHDCCARDLVYVGTTTRGTRLSVNAEAAGAGYRIVLGGVSPHEFAGFSGGRKYVLPGIASEEAILYNHSPEMLKSPLAIPGILEGNPISEDMVEAAELFGIDFCVSLVQNADGSVAGIFCGALKSAHLAAVSFMRQSLGISVPAADLIVTTPGHPLSINLYQSLKALFALSPVLGPDTVVLIYSRCRDGVGGDEMLEPFVFQEPDDIIHAAVKDYRIVKDHSILLAKLYKEKGAKVVFASPGLDPACLGHMFHFASRSFEEALDFALTLCPPEPGVLFYPKPQRTLPGPANRD